VLAVLRRQVGRHPTRVFTFRGQEIANVNTKAWKAALKRAGIEDFRWHDLRHTFATWHRQAGTPTHELQRLGGWKTGAMVERYVPDTAPDCIKKAHAAPSDHHEGGAVAWDKYCEAQGGVMCGRKALIKLKKEQPEKVGRYGEQQAPRPTGVLTDTVDESGSIHCWEMVSSRLQWEIARGLHKTPATPYGFSLAEAQPLTPWTCVNNCTDSLGKASSKKHSAWHKAQKLNNWIRHHG
jgi:hypothetical protein